MLADMRTVIVGRSQMDPNPGAAAMILLDNIAKSNAVNDVNDVNAVDAVNGVNLPMQLQKNRHNAENMDRFHDEKMIDINTRDVRRAAELSVDQPFHVLAEMMRTQKSSGIGTSDRLKLLG